jgi:hypothetical protein
MTPGSGLYTFRELADAYDRGLAAGQAAERERVGKVVEAAKVMHEFLYDNELCNEPCGPEADCNLRAALKALDAGGAGGADGR